MLGDHTLKMKNNQQDPVGDTAAGAEPTGVRNAAFWAHLGANPEGPDRWAKASRASWSPLGTPVFS